VTGRAAHVASDTGTGTDGGDILMRAEGGVVGHAEMVATGVKQCEG